MRRMQSGWGRMRAAGAVAVAALAAAALGGCIQLDPAVLQARMNEARRRAESPTAQPAPRLLLTMTADRSLIRPGEALVVEVALENTGHVPLHVRAMRPDGPRRGDEGALIFRVSKSEEDPGRQIYPVISRFENEEMLKGDPGMVLQPGEVKRRQFAFVDAAEAAGRYQMTANYDPYRVSGRQGEVKDFPLNYEVYGQRRFERRRDGLIEAEEAMRLALAQSPGEPVAAKTILAEDRRGFYAWWVNVDYLDSRGWTLRQGYLVDPYRGEVTQKTKPFLDEEEEVAAEKAETGEGAPAPQPEDGEPAEPAGGEGADEETGADRQPVVDVAE